MVIDPTGLHFRAETGGRILVGMETDTDGVTFELAWNRPAFFEKIWPVLAERVPLF